MDTRIPEYPNTCPPRVAVSGASGFIGSHLVRALRVAGCELTLGARGPAGPGALPEGDGVHWVHGDLCAGPDAIEALLDPVPAVLYHLAGTRGKGAPDPAVACAEINVGATVRLVAAASRRGVRRIVLIGSAEEYGDQAGPLHEELKLAPVTAYGVSKAASTLFGLSMHTAHGCPVTVVRPFTAYGPGQPPDMFLSQAVRCAVRGEPFSMTQGLQRRDYVYVGDLVRALLAAGWASGLEGQVVNVGSGTATRLRDLAQLTWRLSACPAPLRIGDRPAGAADLFDTWADIRRARELLDWEPRVSLEQGLETMLAATRQGMA